MKASPAAAFFVLMSRPAATSVMVARKFNEWPCLVCGVPNSSSEQLRTHTLGKKHGRQLKLLIEAAKGELAAAEAASPPDAAGVARLQQKIAAMEADVVSSR